MKRHINLRVINGFSNIYVCGFERWNSNAHSPVLKCGRRRWEKYTKQSEAESEFRSSQSCILDSPCHCERAALGSCLEKRSLGQSCLHNSPPSCTGLDLQAEDADWLWLMTKPLYC